MSGSTENQMSGAFEKASGPTVLFTWHLAQKMLPLVGRIVNDILQLDRRLAELHPEKSQLDRNRRALEWSGRSRRYQLQEEIRAVEEALHEALAELDGLGVALVERRAGQVGFPTTVNDRRAYFSWRPGEEDLKHWHYAEEDARRPVPVTWTLQPEPRKRSRRS
jgi:hypothetical protein